MNALPPELLLLIISHLPRSSLSSTLLVSRSFQHATERVSGAFTTYTLNESNAAKLLHIYSSQHRFAYLRNIEFRPVLPEPDAKEKRRNGYPECRESREELGKLDAEFTRQIGFLFSTIRTLEDGQKRFSGLFVGVGVEREGEGEGEEETEATIHLTLFTPTQNLSWPTFCPHRFFSSWRLHLLNPNSILPNLTCIRSLSIKLETPDIYSPQDCCLRRLDSRIILDLADKLPSLETLECLLGGDEFPSPLYSEVERAFAHEYQGPRRDSRHAFAKAMREKLRKKNGIGFPKLRDVRLNFMYPYTAAEYADHAARMPDLVTPALWDPFSVALREMARWLKRMCLVGVVDGTLFWPHDDASNDDNNFLSSCWPCLETLQVVFYVGSASGKYFFKGLRNEGIRDGMLLDEKSYPPLETTAEDEELDESADEFVPGDCGFGFAQFLIVPNDDVLRPFLTAFAKAAANMPALREAAVWCPLRFAPENDDEYGEAETRPWKNPTPVQENLAWGIAYVRPGVRAFSTSPGEDFSVARQIWWKVGAWMPDEELYGLFRNIGRCEYDGGLVEYWNEGPQSTCLRERDDFIMFSERVFPGFELDMRN